MNVHNVNLSPEGCGWCGSLCGGKGVQDSKNTQPQYMARLAIAKTTCVCKTSCQWQSRTLGHGGSTVFQQGHERTGNEELVYALDCSD